MSAAPPRVGVVGGGVLGTSLALRLAQAGAKVTVIERGPSLGGLAGDLRLRRPRGRPLLPRDHAGRPAHDRDGRGGRARRPAALQPGRRRLLRRRRDARLQRRRRPAAVLAAEPGGAPAPGLVRRPVPAAQLLRQARRDPARGLAAPASAASRSGSGSGNRCSTRASTATPRGCRRPTSGPAPGACPAPATARAAAARRWATSSAATSA